MRPVGAGTLLRGEMGFSAAPSALDDFLFRLSTASRPWLLNDGPSDLSLRTVCSLEDSLHLIPDFL